jgi:PIN domain nuclease of toxin-antitoxin system
LNGYLLDTGIALRAVSEPDTVSRAVRNAILKGPAYLSVISFWEVAVKSMKGTLVVRDPHLWFDATLNALALRPLLYRPEHIAELLSLPPIHQDPFDRALVAQAMTENLALLTTDSIIPNYATSTFRVIA